MTLEENAVTDGGYLKHEGTNEIYNIHFYDKKEGIILNNKDFESIEINEYLFSILPTIRLSFSDNGTYYDGYNIKNGDPIYISITPNINKKGEEPKPYIDSEFCVQSMDCLPRNR